MEIESRLNPMSMCFHFKSPFDEVYNNQFPSVDQEVGNSQYPKSGVLNNLFGGFVEFNERITIPGPLSSSSAIPVAKANLLPSGLQTGSKSEGV